MTDQLLSAFLEDLACGLDYWVNTVVAGVEAPSTNGAWMEDPAPLERLSDALGGRVDDLRPVVAEAMRGLVHSVLTAVDGGTASAEVGRVQLTDADGQVLAEGLHELFVDHLLATQRLD